jgi:hypothetical protein
MYARSQVQRKVADSVQDTLWTLRCEYEAAQGAWGDEQVDDSGDEDGCAWSTPEVVAIAVV